MDQIFPTGVTSGDSSDRGRFVVKSTLLFWTLWLAGPLAFAAPISLFDGRTLSGWEGDTVYGQ